MPTCSFSFPGILFIKISKLFSVLVDWGLILRCVYLSHKNTVSKIDRLMQVACYTDTDTNTDTVIVYQRGCLTLVHPKCSSHLPTTYRTTFLRCRLFMITTVSCHTVRKSFLFPLHCVTREMSFYLYFSMMPLAYHMLSVKLMRHYQTTGKYSYC